MRMVMLWEVASIGCAVGLVVGRWWVVPIPAVVWILALQLHPVRLEGDLVLWLQASGSVAIAGSTAAAVALRRGVVSKLRLYLRDE
jgi:hypothetical protein